MPALRHKLISASAGSGKTYQLVRRYLHLLALGEDPARITAVTFTRKAAGEFVNRILLTLSELAEDRAAAKKFLNELEPSPEKKPDFNQVLRSLLAEMPRLRLGTIDSFFAKVAACFPLELGQPVGATIMSEEEERRAKTKTVSQLLARLHREQDRTAASLLLEGFKQATFGNEEKRVLDAIHDWLGKGHDLWHECPDASRWGQPEAIWPHAAHPDAAIWHERRTVKESLDHLAQVFDAEKMNDKARAAWEEIQEQALKLTPGMNPPSQLKTFIERIGAKLEEFRKGSASINYHRCDWEFDGVAAEAALDFFLTVLGRELHTRCQRTQGIRRVVEAYETEYARTVRSRGRLSFADLARLLATTQGDGSWADEDSRAELWFRLDGQVDHWLFDEFQDTSIQQWNIMRGLVDEALQDPEMRRTFFAVGDVKQSIYLWRKAEPALFDHICAQYPDDGESGIHADTLARSWRSSKEVLALVNDVFSQKARLLDLLGAGSLRHWRFDDHSAALTRSAGFSAFLQPAHGDDDDETDEFTLAAAILNEVLPSRRQLTCAVLTRSNKSAVEMTEHLRKHTDLDILSHSEEHPAEDNPATAAVLAVLQLAAHPGDTLALEHLRLTPLAGRFANDEAWRGVVNETLHLLHESGFAPVVELWMQRISEVITMDVFSLRRMEKLADIAAEFDDSGSRDVDEFLETARAHGVRTGATPGAVQVMTVHKSKGLEFDVVIVPVSDKTSLALADAEGLVMKREGIEPAEWVLQYPTKVYLDLDPVLAAQKQVMDEESGFEGLCRLYVAMTRAKRALYVVAPRPPGKSTAVNTARLLRETLGAEGEEGEVKGVRVEWLRTHGEASWFHSEPIREIKPEPPPAVAPEALGEVLRRHHATVKRSTPSGEEAFTVKGSAMFSAGRERGRRMGTLVHDLLAEIEWMDGLKWPDVMALWRRRGLDRDPSFKDAAESLRPVLEDAVTGAVFQKPADHAQAWREKPFEVIHEDRWISGTMDRVILTRDAAGRAVSAWLVDFKTDDVPDAQVVEEKVKGYRPQVELYRLAISRLTGLKKEQVRASLLFVRTRQVVEVE